MNTEKNTLEVGDILYHLSALGKYSGPYIIDRVTRTQAIAGDRRFQRETIGPTKARERGGPLYYLETPEIKLKCRLNAIKSRVANFNYGTLTLDQLERINAIISEPKNS